MALLQLACILCFVLQVPAQPYTGFYGTSATETIAEGTGVLKTSDGNLIISGTTTGAFPSALNWQATGDPFVTKINYPYTSHLPSA